MQLCISVYAMPLQYLRIRSEKSDVSDQSWNIFLHAEKFWQVEIFSWQLPWRFDKHAFPCNCLFSLPFPVSQIPRFIFSTRLRHIKPYNPVLLRLVYSYHLHLCQFKHCQKCDDYLGPGAVRWEKGEKCCALFSAEDFYYKIYLVRNTYLFYCNIKAGILRRL